MHDEESKKLPLCSLSCFLLFVCVCRAKGKEEGVRLRGEIQATRSYHMTTKTHTHKTSTTHHIHANSH